MRLTALPLIVLAVAAPALAAEPRTKAAVIAADDAWGKAEVVGDYRFVDQLLLPGYQSVGTDGKVTSKAKIVVGARARAGKPSAAFAAEVAAWKAAHKVRGDVIMNGDTAVLKWVLVNPGTGDPVSSSDIFVYRGGRWHAIYSQHTSAST